MKIFDRLKTVAVIYAIVGLVLAASDVFLPQFRLFEIWLDSWIIKIVIFGVLWLAAPAIWSLFEGRQRKQRDESHT